MSRQHEWTRENEAAALAELRRAADGSGRKPVMLAYTRQSKSDFNKDGTLRGPSLRQQLDSVTNRPELRGLPVEHFEDADRSGKETSKRPDFLRLMERLSTAAPGEIGAVAFYDQDRFHRNDVAFFHFMADMEERRILVFDGAGLISNVDKLSWKIKAIVAQEEREKVARRVRDNLRFLKRDGHLLGVVPQGYRRVDGEIVEDPEAGPIIREIFRLYATGDYSVRSLAEHLNNNGIRPHRGPNKAKHNRPAAVIFTGDVLKDILGNPVYRGKIMADGELIEGRHPALVDEAIWQTCADVRTRNQRRTTKTWTKHSYPAAPCTARHPRSGAGPTCTTCATTHGTTGRLRLRAPPTARRSTSVSRFSKRAFVRSCGAACPPTTSMRRSATSCGKRSPERGSQRR
jgi:DNA invertase Pin-like site-specific DNA recombinase